MINLNYYILISHNKLIYKLKTFGICGKILLWIKEFLNNRSFAVKLNNYLSKSLPVISSVPQGSKLGPLLYILYANDIMQNFKFAKVKMYVDDLTVYAIVNNINDRIKLQNELNNLLEWSKKWQLNINFDKCHVIHIGKKNLNFDYCFNNIAIHVSMCEQILGVLFDSNLSFREHIFQCVSKASRMCNLIYANIKCTDMLVLVNLYKCYARPLLEYCSVIFSPHYVYLIKLIENVQKRFTKKLPGLQNKCYHDRLKLCNLEPLETRRLHADLILMYKIINSTIHVDLHNCVSVSYSITRGNKYKLNKYHAKLDIRKYFFAFRTVNIWNFLHNDIVSCKTARGFIVKLLDITRFLKGQDVRPY